MTDPTGPPEGADPQAAPRPGTGRPDGSLRQTSSRPETGRPDTPRPRPGAGRHSAPSGQVRLPRSSAALVALIIAAAVVVVAGVLVVVVVFKPKGPSPTPVASAYLSDWERNDFNAMAAVVDFPPAGFQTTYQQTNTNLGVTKWTNRLGTVSTSGNTAKANFTAQVVLGPLGTWTYHGALHLARVQGVWKVEWTPAAIFPSLPVGGHLQLQRTWPARAAVLGTKGTQLAGNSQVVTVGLQGNAIASPALVTSALTQAGIAPAEISSALKQAATHPTQFVPVATLSQARYQQVRSIIFPVPGTRFQTQGGTAGVTADLAAHVVGNVGPITAQQLKTLGFPYQTGDMVGQIGIESQYERQLAGTPSAVIQVLGPDGSVLSTADSIAGKPGQPVQTTLDLTTQQAAESALNGVKQPVALVAIQASTGNVLAAVSRPDNTTFDRALQGQYPPGSTFKVITSSALLSNGLTPGSPAMCPQTITVDGFTFHNFDGESALHATLLQAFEQSCNAAFIGLAQDLPSSALTTAAGQFGFGTTPQLGLPVYGGTIPAPADEVEKVADAIGQGRVLASPLQMASVAAAVANGAYHPPRLVLGAPDDRAAPTPLNASVVANLRTMMAGVVSNGTGTAADLGGATVYGKTGTAEFGNATPPMTHAWFIGFRGDLAFAVVVEGGGVGGQVAAPIAARFLRLLGTNLP